MHFYGLIFHTDTQTWLLLILTEFEVYIDISLAARHINSQENLDPFSAVCFGWHGQAATESGLVVTD